MARLTTLDYYHRTALERGCASIKKLCEYELNLTSLERHVEILVKYCSDNGYCTFDDIPKEAPVEEPVEKAIKNADKRLKKYKKVIDNVDNTPEAQEQEAQNVFKEANKDDPNG